MPKGTVVVAMNQVKRCLVLHCVHFYSQVMCRQECFFSDANSFLPERWLPEPEGNQPPPGFSRTSMTLTTWIFFDHLELFQIRSWFSHSATGLEAALVSSWSPLPTFHFQTIAILINTNGYIQGWTPRPAGKGGFPAPPRPVKMIKTAGKLRGKIKARISTFSYRGNKKWNNITTLNNAQSSLSIGYARESQK